MAVEAKAMIWRVARSLELVMEVAASSQPPLNRILDLMS